MSYGWSRLVEKKPFSDDSAGSLGGEVSFLAVDLVEIRLPVLRMW